MTTQSTVSGEPEPTADTNAAPAEETIHVEVEYAPSRLTQFTAGTLALMIPLSLIGYGFFLGLVGTIGTLVGVLGGRRRWIHAGSLVAFSGVCVAALEGLSVGRLLLPTVLIIVTWDVGRYGILVGEQLGRQAETTRIEAAHTCWSLGVGMVILVVLYGMNFVVLSDSIVGVWLLLLGVLVLVVGLFGEEYLPTGQSVAGNEVAEGPVRTFRAD